MSLPSRFVRSATALALVSLVAIDANAVAVTPGAGSTALPGITAAADPALDGTVIEDVVTEWYSANDPQYGFPGAQGSLQSRVVRETATGTLDFYWRVSAEQPSYPSYIPTILNITGLNLANFQTGGSFDADYRPDGLGESAPTDAYSTKTSSLSFSFDPSTFGPATSTYFLLLHSNATTFDESAVANLGASAIATFAPTAAVPEPTPAALLALALAVGGVVVRRQRRDSIDRTTAN